MPDLGWPELYVVRRGETGWNATGRYQGSTDVPLNDKGRWQAAANAGALRAALDRHGREPADLGWYVSPLSRAIETMSFGPLGAGCYGTRRHH